MQKEEEKEEEELTRIKDVKGGEEDKALQEMTIPTAREAQEQARARVLEQQDDLCKLSRALGVLASASVSKMILMFFNNEYANNFICSLFETLFAFLYKQSVCREREEFLRLVKKEVHCPLVNK